jgi:hypothetical protein
MLHPRALRPLVTLLFAAALGAALGACGGTTVATVSTAPVLQEVPTGTATTAAAAPASPSPAASRSAATAAPSAAPSAQATQPASAPTTPAASGGASAAGAVSDSTGTCQLTLPSGFTAFGDGIWINDGALLLLSSTDTGGQDFATFSQGISSMLAGDSSLVGFAAGKVDQQPDRYRIDFTAEQTSNDPVPSNGTLVAVPAGNGKACIMEFVYHRDQAGNYTAVADKLAASVQAVKR